MWFVLQEISGPVVDGNDPTGHIISTTIGGKNGEPKQVSILGSREYLFVNLLFINFCSFMLLTVLNIKI